jgi:hypothetical protein
MKKIKIICTAPGPLDPVPGMEPIRVVSSGVSLLPILLLRSRLQIQEMEIGSINGIKKNDDQ